MNVNLECCTAYDYVDKTIAIVGCYMNYLIDYSELERVLNNLLYPITKQNYCQKYDDYLNILVKDYPWEYEILCKGYLKGE